MAKFGEPLAFMNAALALPRSHTACVPWPYAEKGGYGYVWIDSKVQRVNRVICERTHGPAPSKVHEAAHSCGKGHEGCINPHHIRWATPQENQADRFDHGTHSRGENNGIAKLTAVQVRAIRASRLPATVVAARYKISLSNINSIRQRKTWAWLP